MQEAVQDELFLSQRGDVVILFDLRLQDPGFDTSCEQDF